MADPRDKSKYGRGHEDGLTPLAPLDPTQTESVDALVRAMSQTAFGGRRLGEAADVLEAMIRDPSCFRVVTVSGAMTIAKQGLLLCEMIDRGWVQAVVTTGALMTHGLSEGAGMLHFKHRPDHEGRGPLRQGLQPRLRHDRAREEPRRRRAHPAAGARGRARRRRVLSSRLVCELLGRHLEKHGAGPRDPGERARAGRAGLRAGLHRLGARPRLRDPQPPAQRARARRPSASTPSSTSTTSPTRIRRHETLGIFTIGGGVPRNWAQQVGPYLEILRTRLGERRARAPLPLRRAHLSGARALGRALRLQLHRRRLLGQVRAARARAAASPRSSPTPPSPGRCWCGP